MPRSHFYWEMSVGAARRTENGESTYSITLDRPTGGERGVGQGGTMKAQIPFSPLNSFIHLFVPIPPSLLPSSLSPSLSVPSLLI